MTNPIPDVSVIVPVFNRAPMIARAILSLQVQTLSNIEIIIIDDGSTDGTSEIVAGIDDPRIRLISHRANRGIPAARNSGLSAATGRYIAWLDSDDIARPERFATQVAFLEANPSVAMVGSGAGRILAESGRRLKSRHPPATHETIRARLLFRTAFQQSSILGRAGVLRQFPYNEQFRVCEDVDMFIRITREYRTANLRAVLIDRYIHPGQTEHGQATSVVANKILLFGRSLARLGIVARDDELRNHVRLGNLQNSRPDRSFLQWSYAWLRRINESNARAREYDRQSLRSVTRNYWIKALMKAPATETIAFYVLHVARLVGAAASRGEYQKDLAQARTAMRSRRAVRTWPWVVQAVGALLLICVGWVARGYEQPPETLTREADEARDMFAAATPTGAGSTQASLDRIARTGRVPDVRLPARWHIRSSGVVSTELGPVLEVSALNENGVPLTIIASHNSYEALSTSPAITSGDNETIASWKTGRSGFAIAAKGSPLLMRRVSAQLYDAMKLG